ncbi:uncharacterized protein LOC127718313 [Mytilus californianus]|uniref:uncharacterized protein LOC127718313 n=1 Tax=Mytilus californianus TaxID=6549 RepID=UPI00224616F3|nr:uncharacterized protein LOC127718313 [Mytilus californianus]
MFFIYIILLLCFSDTGTSLTGLKVCENTQRNIEYCCSGYEDINDTCTECKLGFMSIGGKPCTHCPNNRFGARCLTRCNCNHIEKRCDHVKGCVPKFEVGEDVNYTTRSVVENYSESMMVFELHMFLFGAAILGAIVMIGGCLGFTCFCKERNKMNANMITGLIEDQHVASSSYLQVINGSYGTVIEGNGNEDRCRHLNPYVSLVPKTSNTHYYMYYE